MGASYDTLLVIAEVEAVCQALRDADQEAVVLAVDEGLTAAVLGRGDLTGLEAAEMLSGVLETGALSWGVDDSARTYAYVYFECDEMHEYVSHPLPPTGAPVPVPNPPIGAETELFLSFGTDRADEARLLWALRGGPADPGTPWHRPENQHRLIIEALGLDPAPFVLDFDQAMAANLHGARHVPASDS